MKRAGTDQGRLAGGANRRPRLVPHIRSRLLWFLAAGVLVTASLGLTLGLRGQASNRPADSAGLRAELQASAPLVVFSEFGEDADTLWAANPDNPDERRDLARVPHVTGFGIGPSLSPDGNHVAFVVLPPGISDPRGGPQVDTPAELWAVETLGGEPRRLAGGVDLLTTPVWSKDSTAVIARTVDWGEDGSTHSRLLQVDLAGTVTPLIEADALLYPVDYSPDGAWLYYAAVAPSGSDLARVPASGGPPATLHHLSDGLSRDWRLSPDGAQIAYLAEAPADAGTAFVAQVLDLATGEQQTPLPDLQVAQFAAVWEPAGELTVGRYQPGAGAPVRIAEGSGLATAAVSEPPSGFDVPVVWSPDGGSLAVRNFEGGSPAEPGTSHVELVDAEGGRVRLSEVSDVQIAGWLQ